MINFLGFMNKIILIILLSVFYYESSLLGSPNYRNTVIQGVSEDTVRVDELISLGKKYLLSDRANYAQHEKGHQSLREALALSIKLNYLSGRINSLIAIGEGKFRDAEYTAAEKYFAQHLKLCRSVGDTSGMTISYLYFTSTLIKEHEYEKAKLHIELATEFFSKAGQIAALRQNMELLLIINTSEQHELLSTIKKKSDLQRRNIYLSISALLLLTMILYRKGFRFFRKPIQL
jgi:hypothetical protein